MGKLYVAKVNLISNIQDLYKGNNLLKMKQAVYAAIPDVVEYKQIISKLNADAPIREEYNYTVIIGYRSETELCGTIVRESKIRYKTLKKGKNVKDMSYRYHNPEIAEEITFLYDVFAEKIAFNIKNRFKWKQFMDGMTGIINKCMADNKLDYIFELSMCTTEIDVNKLKDSLKSIPKITELEFKFQLPNPDEDVEKIKNNPEAYIEGLESGNIDDFSNIFRSKKGINIDSKPINDNLNMVNQIHSTISGEEALKNGYVKVFASNIEGIHYSSEEDGIFSRDIDPEVQFIDFCRETIKMLRKR